MQYAFLLYVWHSAFPLAKALVGLPRVDVIQYGLAALLPSLALNCHIHWHKHWPLRDCFFRRSLPEELNAACRVRIASFRLRLTRRCFAKVISPLTAIDTLMTQVSQAQTLGRGQPGHVPTNKLKRWAIGPSPNMFGRISFNVKNFLRNRTMN